MGHRHHCARIINIFLEPVLFLQRYQERKSNADTLERLWLHEGCQRFLRHGPDDFPGSPTVSGLLKAIFLYRKARKGVLMMMDGAAVHEGDFYRNVRGSSARAVLPSRTVPRHGQRMRKADVTGVDLLLLTSGEFCNHTFHAVSGDAGEADGDGDGEESPLMYDLGASGQCHSTLDKDGIGPVSNFLGPQVVYVRTEAGARFLRKLGERALAYGANLHQAFALHSRRVRVEAFWPPVMSMVSADPVAMSSSLCRTASATSRAASPSSSR